MMLTRFLTCILVAISLLTAACDSRRSDREEPKAPPTGNERPPVTDNRQFEPELKDKVWRLTAPGLTMRYDRGGVLFQSSPHTNEVRILDLDGATDATFSFEGVASDSLLIAPSLIVNGTAHRLLEGKMMGSDATTRWYRLLAPDSTIRVLVVPIEQ